MLKTTVRYTNLGIFLGVGIVKSSDSITTWKNYFTKFVKINYKWKSIRLISQRLIYWCFIYCTMCTHAPL